MNFRIYTDSFAAARASTSRTGRPSARKAGIAQQNEATDHEDDAHDVRHDDLVTPSMSSPFIFGYCTRAG